MNKTKELTIPETLAELKRIFKGLQARAQARRDSDPQAQQDAMVAEQGGWLVEDLERQLERKG